MKLIIYLPGSEPDNFLDIHDQPDLLEISLQEYNPSELCRYIKEANPEKIFWLGLEDKPSIDFLSKSLVGESVSSEYSIKDLFQGYVNAIMSRPYNSTIISTDKRIRTFSQLNNISTYGTLEDTL